MEKHFIIERESADVFTVLSDFPFWEDGRELHTRVAWSSMGHLSATRAQTLDRAAGIRYVLVAPVSFSNPKVVEAARALGVGESIRVAV